MVESHGTKKSLVAPFRSTGNKHNKIQSITWRIHEYLVLRIIRVKDSFPLWKKLTIMKEKN